MKTSDLPLLTPYSVEVAETDSIIHIGEGKDATLSAGYDQNSQTIPFKQLLATFYRCVLPLKKEW
jgi:hypothetical protein